MIKNPNTWAVNLESLLNVVGNASLRCYFYSLGNQYGGPLFVNDQASDISSVMSVATAKTYIDKLAGNNSLHHNFITDPRIALWSVGNEVNLGSSASPNSNYNWVIQICDYIRSKGGLVDVPSPQIDGAYNNYASVQSLLAGHVDYLEMHPYGIWQLANQYSLGNNQYNWAGWEGWIKTQLQTALNTRGPFTIDKVIVGEFGLWRGVGSDMGLTAYSFTDQNRIDYYTHYFNAIRQVGLKNVCFHYSIEENSQYGNPDECRYGMITPVPDGAHFTGPAGQPYPGYEKIKANFG